MRKMFAIKIFRHIKAMLPSKKKKIYTKQFFFLHIPKTAGTSLRNIVEYQFLPRQINKPYDIKGVSEINQKKFDRFDLIRGHFVYSLVEKFREKPYVITMLREPVARTISHLNHIIKSSDFWLHKKIPISKMSVHEILNNELTQKLLCNHQLRLIACDYNLETVENPMLDSPHLIGTDILEKGKEILKKADYVGIAEQFDDSIKLLTKTFGWSVPENIVRLNTAKKKKSDNVFSPEIIEQIQEMCKLDTELYNFAVDIFNKNISIQ